MRISSRAKWHRLPADVSRTIMGWKPMPRLVPALAQGMLMKSFQGRAEKIIEQFDAYEVLDG